MLKFWLYILVLIVVCILGLSIGSANDSVVTFDFLIVKTDLSLAMVLVVGVVIGVLIGLYLSSFLCLKMWFKARSSRSELKQQLKLQQQKLQQQKTRELERQQEA